MLHSQLQEGRLVRRLNVAKAAEVQARSMADSACTLLRAQAAELSDATAQREVCLLHSNRKRTYMMASATGCLGFAFDTDEPLPTGIANLRNLGIQYPARVQ
jgi:hypothetical protein